MTAPTPAETVVEGRAAALERMTDECVITRVAGPARFDSTTGTRIEPATTGVYAGVCEVQVVDALGAESPEVGGQLVTLLRTIVKIPVSALGVEVNDEVEITAVGPDSDPELLDKRFRVEATHAKTYATARRLRCEEIVG